MTMLIVGGIVVLLIIVFARTRKPETEYIYYDPDEVFPPRPQSWGVDDYQPWPGVHDEKEGTK